MNEGDSLKEIQPEANSPDVYKFVPPAEKGKGPPCIRCSKGRMVRTTYGLNGKGIVPRFGAKSKDEWAGPVNIMYCPWCGLKIRSFASDATWRPFGRAKLPEPYEQMKGEAKPYFEFVESPMRERVIAPDPKWEFSIGLAPGWRQDPEPKPEEVQAEPSAPDEGADSSNEGL